MKQKLLLLEDVEGLGRKGEIVTAKPGYVRNFLFPKRFAVTATLNTLRKQEMLRKERAEQAVTDLKESQELAARLEGVALETRVKVDPEGRMYGSVGTNDIASLFQAQGFPIDRRFVYLQRPIKIIGVHQIELRLKEGVHLTFKLNILGENEHGELVQLRTVEKAKASEAPVEAVAEEAPQAQAAVEEEKPAKTRKKKKES